MSKLQHIAMSVIALASLVLGGVALAQDDGLKLTGWPYEVDVVTENLGRFTDQTGHDAVFLPFPSNEYRDKMVASFVAGTEFDVAYVRDSYLAEWASAGWILPITDLEGADELLADLPAGIVEQMSYDGEVYGLPYYSGVQTMAYNAAHLAAAGVDGPPETWDEMLDAGADDQRRRRGRVPHFDAVAQRRKLPAARMGDADGVARRPPLR